MTGTRRGRPPGGDPTGLLEVGRIGRPHGVRGDLLVDLVTDRTERLAPGSILVTDLGPLTVASAQLHLGRWIVHFAELGDRGAAERYINQTLRAAPLDDPDALWVHDLVGSTVVERDTGRPRGRCVAVLANPAHDLLELDDGTLVPVVFVESCRDGVCVVAAPAGLFDTGDPV